MFKNVPKSEITIIGKDGDVRHTTKAIMGDPIVIPDQSVSIFAGDEIRRLIPSGAEETFEVLDPIFYQSHGRIPAHYQVKIRRKGMLPQGTGGNYTIHVTGSNSRVNVNSSDNSHNVVVDHSVFGNVRTAIESGVSNEADRTALLALVSTMEAASGDRNSYLKAYQNFIAAAANHVTVIAPFLAGLAALLGG
ncbi:hypothetical protein [Mesorhizobium neociceri]|uniref:Uncharacterized protein n=1 Tax=Mesorhizobium neociceri TaxID=1307853 RepID=A0A838B0H0_9HYPH|nr:hypothetical protein [Mesorhizobium neociceri]MBA1139497.1 hypothetical protein [Mesorhizobium neociceri]